MRALAAQWRQAAFSLNETRLQIQRAWSGLDWEVRQDVALEALVVQAQRQALALMDEAERLGRFIEDRAAAFEQADEEGLSRIAQASGMWIAEVGGMEALRPSPAFAFPSGRVHAYLGLGKVMEMGTSSLHIASVAVEPEERRALFNFATDQLLSKIGPVGALKDLLDVTSIPSWNQRVEQAFRSWNAARLQYGVNAPQPQAAYGLYIDELIFKMPFVGTGAQALLAVLKIVGRMNPVE